MIIGKAAYFYRWLYYRCYRYSEKADSRFAIHWANASVSVFVILVMNLMDLGLYGAFVHGILKNGMALPSPTGTISSNPVSPVVVLILLGIIILHTVFLGYKGRYKRIIKEFSNENAEQQRRGDRLFAWYVVVSLGLLIIAVIITLIIAIRQG